jgi:hypothetical protein
MKVCHACSEKTSDVSIHPFPPRKVDSVNRKEECGSVSTIPLPSMVIDKIKTWALLMREIGLC